jgi:L-aspartate oxidase
MSGFDAVETADVVVVGSGVAGMTTALQAEGLDLMLVTKTALEGGSTLWAQGGIAVALALDDDAGTHALDTIAVGAGLNDPDAVLRLTSGGRAGIADLIERGATFDRENGDLALGREAGHSRRRILHSFGDATGAEVARTLAGSVRAASHIRVAERTFVADLVVEDGAVCGITMLGPAGEAILVRSPAVVIATGGVGQLYAATTNPPEVTGDGLAMALRAGAAVADLEFVQFHPTALATGHDPMPLLSEAIRGEGATLIDDEGSRFMVELHPDAELAPRDVVARGIWGVITGGRKVFLDATTGVGERFPERFPTVYRLCLRDAIDPRTQPVPVSPAAHYHMGGVAVNVDGRSSLRGLWAVGEASRSGVHGANRLASNSLLEGLVFGSGAAADIARFLAGARRQKVFAVPPRVADDSGDEVVGRLRMLMWDRVGLVRDRGGLVAALEEMELMGATLASDPSEARNMLRVGHAIATAALARAESRGAHFRSDFPAIDPDWQHSLVFT